MKVSLILRLLPNFQIIHYEKLGRNEAVKLLQATYTCQVHACVLPHRTSRLISLLVAVLDRRTGFLPRQSLDCMRYNIVDSC